jgi:hypothetical protein
MIPTAAGERRAQEPDETCRQATAVGITVAVKVEEHSRVRFACANAEFTQAGDRRRGAGAKGGAGRRFPSLEYP